MKVMDDLWPHGRRLWIIVLGLFFLPTVTAQLGEKDFLAKIGSGSWSPEEVSALQRGEVVVRPIETAQKFELATIGILRMKDLPPISIDRFRESLSQRSSEAMKAGGRFSDPPTEADLDELKLDADTIDQLQKCNPGKCDLNLSAKMIVRFQTEIDWTSPEAGADATRLLKQMIVNHARDYLARGDSSLGAYDNRRRTVNLAESHRSLLSSSSLINGLAPEFIKYLQQFPVGDLENAENSMHWSVVDFGLKPSITVSHTVAYSQVRAENMQLFVASKQIYSSRYLDSSVTFTLLLRVATDAGQDAYLVFVDRSRSDALEGRLGHFAKTLVQKESVERIKTMLDKAHQRLLVNREPPPLIDPDPDRIENSWVATASRSRSVLIAGIIVIIAIASLLFRRRSKRKRFRRADVG